jgi:FkbM family methyltransferase
MIKESKIYKTARALKYKAILFRKTLELRIQQLSITIAASKYSIYKRYKNNNIGETEQLDWFLDKINGGDVVWDVGSYIGIYALFASRLVGIDGRVTAFEPIRDNVCQIEKNIKHNNIENIIVEPCALSDKSYDGAMYTSEKETMHSLITSNHNNNNMQGVKIISGNEYKIQTNQIPNVVKIDVEGAELNVLIGMSSILNNPECRAVLIEVHLKQLHSQGIDPNQIEKLMSSSGFSISHKMKRGSEIHWGCEKG